MRLPHLSTPASKPSNVLSLRKKPVHVGKAKDCATRIEALESRIALSVTIKVAAQDIFISGDNTANHIALFQDGGGNLFIYGDTSTAIAGDGVVSAAVPDTNAGGGREFNSGLFKNLYVSMGSGDDTVNVAGLRAGDVASLTINTGGATTGDTVVFSSTTFVGIPDTSWGPNAVAGPVTILTGNGANTVTLHDLTANSLNVTTGSGNDTINLATAGGLIIHGNATIDAGDGSNTITAAAGAGNNTTTVDGHLSLRTGSGSDTVSLDALTAGSLSISTGAGTDSINLSQNSAMTIHGDAFIQGDAAKKTILVGSINHATVIDGNLNITLGSGSDSVTLDFLTVGNVKGGLNISTGLGDDVVKVASTGDVSVPHGSVTIDTGDASTIDSVTVGAANHTVAISGDLAIRTGSGDDAVILDSLTVGNTFGSLTISTGTGNDTITLAANGRSQWRMAQSQSARVMASAMRF